MRRWLKVSGVATGVLAAWATVFACRAPTQGTLVLKSALPCSSITSGADIFVGASADGVEGAFQSRFVTATASACQANGDLGTLVITPDGDTAAVLVVAGVDGVDSARCTADTGYEGCIIARRRFSFVAHTPLTVPIVLTRDCVGVACDVERTCNRGVCVSSEIACTEDGCDDIPDGGAPPPDGGTSQDAGTDASADAGVDGGLTTDPKCGATTGAPMAWEDFRKDPVDGGDTLDERFCIDRREVTQAEYAAFLAKKVAKDFRLDCLTNKPLLDPLVAQPHDPSSCDETTFTPGTTPNRPVVCVDQCDADTYCRAIGKRLCKPNEWLFVCEGGTPANVYTYGRDHQPGVCNDTSAGVGAPVDVASRPGCTNTLYEPVYDMTGNVWEWVENIAPKYSHGGSFNTPPTGSTPEQNLGCRNAQGPTTISYDRGFRCCKDALVP